MIAFRAASLVLCSCIAVGCPGACERRRDPEAMGPAMPNVAAELPVAEALPTRSQGCRDWTIGGKSGFPAWEVPWSAMPERIIAAAREDGFQGPTEVECDPKLSGVTLGVRAELLVYTCAGPGFFAFRFVDDSHGLSPPRVGSSHRLSPP